MIQMDLRSDRNIFEELDVYETGTSSSSSWRVWSLVNEKGMAKEMMDPARNLV